MPPFTLRYWSYGDTYAKDIYYREINHGTMANKYTFGKNFSPIKKVQHTAYNAPKKSYLFGNLFGGALNGLLNGKGNKYYASSYTSFEKKAGHLRITPLYGIEHLIPIYLPLQSKNQCAVFLNSECITNNLLAGSMMKSNGKTRNKNYSSMMINKSASQMYNKFNRIENVRMNRNYDYINSQGVHQYPPEMDPPYELGKSINFSVWGKEQQQRIADYRFYGSNYDGTIYDINQTKLDALASKLVGKEVSVTLYKNVSYTKEEKEYWIIFLNKFFPKRKDKFGLTFEVKDKSYTLDYVNQYFITENNEKLLEVILEDNTSWCFNIHKTLEQRVKAKYKEKIIDYINYTRKLKVTPLYHKIETKMATIGYIQGQSRYFWVGNNNSLVPELKIAQQWIPLVEFPVKDTTKLARGGGYRYYPSILPVSSKTEAIFTSAFGYSLGLKNFDILNSRMTSMDPPKSFFEGGYIIYNKYDPLYSFQGYLKAKDPRVEFFNQTYNPTNFKYTLKSQQRGLYAGGAILIWSGYMNNYSINGKRNYGIQALHFISNYTGHPSLQEKDRNLNNDLDAVLLDKKPEGLIDLIDNDDDKLIATIMNKNYDYNERAVYNFLKYPFLDIDAYNLITPNTNNYNLGIYCYLDYKNNNTNTIDYNYKVLVKIKDFYYKIKVPKYTIIDTNSFSTDDLLSEDKEINPVPPTLKFKEELELNYSPFMYLTNMDYKELIKQAELLKPAVYAYRDGYIEFSKYTRDNINLPAFNKMKEIYASRTYVNETIRINKAIAAYLEQESISNIELETMDKDNNVETHLITSMTYEDFINQCSTRLNKKIRTMPQIFLYYQDHYLVGNTTTIYEKLGLGPCAITFSRTGWIINHSGIIDGDFGYNVWDKHVRLYLSQLNIDPLIMNKFENEGFSYTRKNLYQNNIYPNKMGRAIFRNRNLGAKQLKKTENIPFYDVPANSSIVTYSERPFICRVGVEGKDKIKGKPTANEEKQAKEKRTTYGEYTDVANSSQCDLRYYIGQKFSFTIFLNPKLKNVAQLAKAGYIYIEYCCKLNNIPLGTPFRTISLYVPHRIPIPAWTNYISIKRAKMNIQEIKDMQKSYECEMIGDVLIFKSRTKQEKMYFNFKTYIRTYRDDYKIKDYIDLNMNSLKNIEISEFDKMYKKATYNIKTNKQFPKGFIRSSAELNLYLNKEKWWYELKRQGQVYPNDVKNYYRDIPQYDFKIALIIYFKKKPLSWLLAIYNKHFNTNININQIQSNPIEKTDEFLSTNISSMNDNPLANTIFTPRVREEKIHEVVNATTITQPMGGNMTRYLISQNSLGQYDYRNLCFFYDKYLYGLYTNQDLYNIQDTDILFPYNLNLTDTKIELIPIEQIYNGLYDKLEEITGDINYISTKNNYWKLNNINNALINDLFPIKDIRSEESWKRFLYKNTYIVPDEIYKYYNDKNNIGEIISLKNIIKQDNNICRFNSKKFYNIPYLPMFIDVYKKIPYQAKIFFEQCYYTMDIWSDQILLTKRKNTLKVVAIVEAVVMIVIAIVITYFAPYMANWTAAWIGETLAAVVSTIATIGAIAGVAASILNFLGTFVFKGALAQMLLKLSKVAMVVSAVASAITFVASIPQALTNLGKISFNIFSVSGLTNIMNLASVGLQIADKIISARMEDDLNKRQQEIQAIEKANEDLEQVNENMLIEIIENRPIVKFAPTPEKVYNEHDNRIDGSTNLDQLTQLNIGVNDNYFNTIFAKIDY